LKSQLDPLRVRFYLIDMEPSVAVKDRISTQIAKSKLISRDLSWLKFNYRVFEQAKNEDRNLFERLKFLAISASNLDEFFMIRVGSLYNYLDFQWERIDYSGLRETVFRKKLLSEVQSFVNEFTDYFQADLKPLFEKNDFQISKVEDLSEGEKKETKQFFKRTVFPMLTPMVFDSYHPFPILMNLVKTFGVVTKNPDDKKENKKLSFIQIPQNLPRFYEIERNDQLIFIPMEEIVRTYIYKLFRNVEIISVDLFRITRNGDFTLEESEDIETDFVEEVKRKLKTRKTGRVVRVQIEQGFNKWMMKILRERWEIDDYNIFLLKEGDLMDYTRFWQIIKHNEFKDKLPIHKTPVKPLSYPEIYSYDIFEVLKSRDILLHHPYNSIDPLLDLLEKSAEDPNVLSIKLTIYRLAKDSRVTNALLKAAENGKHVSVLFEVKARFDEENNIQEAKKLQNAGCYVIYGISNLKTHTKLLLIVRKEGKKVTRYVHMSSGNYNEDTSRLYTDIGILSSDEVYAEDISEFFNVITGHSLPHKYQNLITAPRDMRGQLISLIRNETENARKGLPNGIVIKINSLQDKETIEELYEASQTGVTIKLIVRGICCLRPGRKDLSENIAVRSIVGEFLEHSRLYYFHNNNDPKVLGGSADVMVRSFDRRIESLFLITDQLLKKQCINILHYNLKDNVNSYIMNEDGTYSKERSNGETPFDIHGEFFNVQLEELNKVALF